MRIQFSPSYARLAMNDSYYWPVSMEHVRAALPVYEDRSIRARDALLLPADFVPRSDEATLVAAAHRRVVF